MITVPEGFRPHTFASLLARFMPVHPRIGIELALLAEPTCDANHEIGPGVTRIAYMEEQELIQFAENPDGEPALFVAPASAFHSPELLKAAHRMVSWFDSAGDFDAATGTIKPDPRAAFAFDATTGKVQAMSSGEVLSFDEYMHLFPLAVPAVARMLRCSRRVVEEVIRRWWETNADWRLIEHDDDDIVQFGKSLTDVPESDKKILRALSAYAQVRSGRGDVRKETLQHLSYMRAVESQYAALTFMEEAEAALSADDRRWGVPLPYGRLSVDILFADDIRALRGADTYCWFPEPLHAADVAAATLPVTTTLSRDLTESAAAWWHFMEPYPIRTSAAHDHIEALLWYWVKHTDGTEGVQFSVYVFDEPTGRPMPSTLFYWQDGHSLQQAMEKQAVAYKSAYDVPDSALRVQRAGLLGFDATIHVIERLMRLWAAAAIWIQQRILTYSPGHIERHERKRMERGRFQHAVRDVQIIELRRRAYTSDTAADGTERAVDWQCRWIVRGHFREQWYPREDRHKTKFIEPYDKGPADKPLKVPQHTVYKVDR